MNSVLSTRSYTNSLYEQNVDTIDTKKTPLEFEIYELDCGCGCIGCYGVMLAVFYAQRVEFILQCSRYC